MKSASYRRTILVARTQSNDGGTRSAERENSATRSPSSRVFPLRNGLRAAAVDRLPGTDPFRDVAPVAEHLHVVGVPFALDGDEADEHRKHRAAERG